MDVRYGASNAATASKKIEEQQKLSAVSIAPSLPSQSRLACIEPSVRLIEQAVGELPGVAALVCGMPFASLVLPGANVTWSRESGRTGATALPDHLGLDEYAMSRADFLEIADVAADDRFAARHAGPRLGYYAGAPLVAADGQVLGILSLMDLVPRRLAPHQRTAMTAIAAQAATQFAMSEELIFARAVGASAPVALYHSDMNGNLTYANPEYRRIFGLRPEQSTDDWAQGVHPDDRARMADAWAEFCRQKQPTQFEYRTVSNAGSIRYFAEQVVRADGVHGFIGTISDFTDLVAARHHLLENQTLLETVFTNLPIALLACDADGRITRHNDAAAELFQLAAPPRVPQQAPSPVPQKSPSPVQPTADGESATRDSLAGDAFDRLAAGAQIYFADGATPMIATEHPLARALRGETIRDLELVIVARGSPPRTTLSNARRLAGPDGETKGAVLVVQDVTARKLADLELERVHKQLMGASRQAGMAEIATNVLHNIGNVLNSVNVSASLLAERIGHSKPAGLARVAALLNEYSADLGEFISTDARGRTLPTYLAQLAGQLQADQRVALEELASLRGNIEHIKDTVTMQQNYAKLCGVTETVAVANLVEDALRMNTGALTRHGVAVRRDIDDVPPITVDKHKVLQILVNLVRNAKYACDDSGRPDKQLLVQVKGAGERVRIAIIDNGVGIAPENMAKLFRHGFTTREAGHGFGLHSGALTARELGGSLTARSDGPGCGAAFVLELPLVAPHT